MKKKRLFGITTICYYGLYVSTISIISRISFQINKFLDIKFISSFNELIRDLKIPYLYLYFNHRLFMRLLYKDISNFTKEREIYYNYIAIIGIWTYLFYIIFDLMILLAFIGILKRKNWARMLLVTIAIVCIISYVIEFPLWLSSLSLLSWYLVYMITPAAILIYFNLPKVKEQFK